MRRRLPLAAAALLGACQPSVGRLLLIDYALSEPVTLEQTAAPWRDAGYTVEYRRFYPHLTRDDLARYGTILVLGGSEPERPSDALTIGDLALLTDWVTRKAGGVVVLGYGGGALDRWVMNRWLDALGTGIAIETQAQHDVAVPQPRSALDNAGFAPFPAGASHGLRVRDASQALARAPTRSTPLVAASRRRAGGGLVVVLSRRTLAAGAGAADFLEALARWTRRPAEWASIAPATPFTPLVVRGAPRGVAPDPPVRHAPAGAAVIALPLAQPPGGPRGQPSSPTWISRQGMRVLWTDVAPRSRNLDSILAFADLAALNAIATETQPDALAESLPPASRAAPRTPWQAAAERLRATSFRWFPAITFGDLPVELAQSQVRPGRRRLPVAVEPVTVADEVDRHGALAPLPCGLDSLFWRGAIRPAFRALTRLGGGGADVVTGVAIDLEDAGDAYAGMGFCEADWRAGLAGLNIDSATFATLLPLPPVARYDTLMQRGLLDAYYGALERAVGERAAALRAELRRLHPDLRFALRAQGAPLDWFSLGLLRGFSTPEVPLYLWTDERDVRSLLHRFAERDITALSAVRLEPSGTAQADWQRRRPLAFTEHDGFWLPAAGADTVGRLIRRFVR